MDLWQGRKQKMFWIHSWNVSTFLSLSKMWYRIGWVKDRKSENRSGMISFVTWPWVTVLGAWVIICVYSFPLYLFHSRQALAPEHTPAFLQCLSWFFSSYFVYPPPLSPVVTCTFLPPTSLHSMPHPLSPFFPPILCNSPMKAGSNRRSICIYITHVMCSVLLWSGWTAWYQHDTLGIRVPVISSSHSKAHFTWNMSGVEHIFYATCPFYHLSAIFISSPPSRHFVLCGKYCFAVILYMNTWGLRIQP